MQYEHPAIAKMIEFAARHALVTVDLNGDRFYPTLAVDALRRWANIEQSIGADNWMALVCKRARLPRETNLN